MKEIGRRQTDNGIIYIAELTQVEFDSMVKPSVQAPVSKDFAVWQSGFWDTVNSLNLDIKVKNTVLRALRRAEVPQHRIAFSDEFDNLLGFSQWREMILSRPVSRQAIARNFPKILEIRGLGMRSVKLLIESLKESEINGLE